MNTKQKAKMKASELAAAAGVSCEVAQALGALVDAMVAEVEQRVVERMKAEQSMPEVFTVAEAARVARISPRTLRNWIARGDVVAVGMRTGKRVIPKSEVQRLLGADVEEMEAASN